MNKEDNGIRRFQLILGAIFAAASVLYLLTLYLTGIEGEVINSYFPYADELMHGIIPETEHSPFALLFIFLPRLFFSTPFEYNIAFVAEVFVFLLIGLVAMGKLAKRYYQNQRMIMLAYTVLMLLMFQFVADRYDIFPTILTMLSFYFFVTKKYVWAFALLSIASMTNLYPAVLFPIYLFPFLINRDWSNTLKGAGTFVVIAFLIVLPFIVVNQDSALHFISNYIERPLQVESSIASLIAFGSALGLTGTWVEFSHGTDNLMGSWPDAVVPYMIPLMLLAMIVIYVVHAYLLVELRKDGRDSENNRMVLLGGAALLSFSALFIFGKAFPSQYLILIIPFIIFMMMTSISHTAKRRTFVLSMIVIALTQLNFAVNIGISGGGAGITDAGMMIILARNIVMVILFAYVIKISVENARKGPWSVQTTDE